MSDAETSNVPVEITGDAEDLDAAVEDATESLRELNREVATIVRKMEGASKDD